MSVSPNSIDSQPLNTILTSDHPREDDGKVVRRLLGMYTESVRHPVWRQYRTEASQCYRYREGDQWTAQEIKELEDRGQPVTTINEIKPIVDRVHGQFIQTRQSTTYLGRNTPVDDESAEVLVDLSRHADQQNEFEFAESDITLDALTAGIGWLELDTTENELGQTCIYEGWEDPLVMFPDPFFRKHNLKDAKYLSRSKWIDLDDCIALAPTKEREIRAACFGHAYEIYSDDSIDAAVRNDPFMVFVDPNRQRMRPVETWYRRKVRQYRVFTPDGSSIVTEPLSVAERRDLTAAFGKDAFRTEPTIGEQMWKGIFIAGLLLYHEPWPRNYFPFVPCIADRKKNGQPFGLVKNLIPIQDAINKRESKALSLFSNRRTLAEEGAVKNIAEFQDENARPDGFMEVANGALAQGKIQILENTDIGAANMQMLQSARMSMPRVSGVPEEAMGFRTEVRSGLGIAKKQQMTNLVTNPVVQNIRKFRFTKQKLQLILIKEVYTEEMTFQVTDDPNKARLVSLTKDKIHAIKERYYDIVVADAPDYLTVQEEQLEKIFQLFPSMAQLGPGMMKVAISMTTLRNKEGLIKMLDESMQPPPPPPPKLNVSITWADMSDEEKAFIAMTSMGSPEFAQFLAERAGDPAWLGKVKADLAKTNIKEGTRATLERGKLDVSAMQTAMQGHLQAREMLAKNDKSSAEASGG